MLLDCCPDGAADLQEGAQQLLPVCFVICALQDPMLQDQGQDSKHLQLQLGSSRPRKVGAIRGWRAIWQKRGRDFSLCVC